MDRYAAEVELDGLNNVLRGTVQSYCVWSGWELQGTVLSYPVATAEQADTAVAQTVAMLVRAGCTVRRWRVVQVLRGSALGDELLPPLSTPAPANPRVGLYNPDGTSDPRRAGLPAERAGPTS